MIVEDDGGWVFEVPTEKVVPVPPPRPRLAEVTPEAIDPLDTDEMLVFLPDGAWVRIPR